MFVVNTDVSIAPISSEFYSSSASFINDDRQVLDIQTLSSLPSLDHRIITFSDNILTTDVVGENIVFITNNTPVSSLVSTVDGLSSNSFVTDYDVTLHNFTQTQSAYIDNQFFGIIGDTLNILPLKSFADIENNLSIGYKNYQKVYGRDIPYYQYKITSAPVKAVPDVFTIVYNSYGVPSQTISDTSYIEDGALGGDCPLNSDMIMFYNNEYESSTDIGENNDVIIDNGSLLCLWLSSKTYEPSSEKIWMERWYDANVSTNDALTFTNIPSASFVHTVDVSSSKVLSEKEKFIYLRHGENKNSSYIANFGNAVLDISSWNANLNTESVSGYIRNYIENSDTLKLDGSVYGTIIPNDNVLIRGNMSFSMWFRTAELSDNQLFGNFYNGQGYGISINMGHLPATVTIPSVSGDCYTVNHRGFKVFNKNIQSEMNLSGLNITFIKTDLFGNRWIYDEFNQSIYKLENDDLITESIILPSDTILSTLEFTSDNRLIIMDTYSNYISSFDNNGVYLSSGAVDTTYSTFTIDSTDSIILDNNELVVVDNYDRIIKIIGSTVYVDGVKILHLLDKPHSVKVDDDNNIWALCGKRVVKFDISGSILLNIQSPIYSSQTGDGEITFVSDGNNGLYVWIIVYESKKIAIIDKQGTLIKILNLSNMEDAARCSFTQYNIKGDFSGFDTYRKFNKIDNLITKDYPAITTTISLICGNDNRIVRIHNEFINSGDWVHVAFTVDHSYDTTIINTYINGVKGNSVELAGLYSINHGSSSTPFIIGGYTGKLGPRILEKALASNSFFKGNISNIKIYNSALTDFQIQGLSRERHFQKWSPIYIKRSIPETTLIEQTDKIHINRYRGYKSNKFNIVIKNFSEDSNIRQMVTNYILNTIDKFVPANTVLNSIIFE